MPNSITGTVEVDGSQVPASALLPAFDSLANFGIGGTASNFSTSSGTSATLTALRNLTQRFTAGSATTVTIDYAYNIVNTIVGAFNGMTFPFVIITNASTTIATPTLSSGSGGVTLSGTTTVLAAAARWYQGQITQLTSTTGSAVTAGTTFTSIAQVGSTNAFTLTLSGNSISPTEGNLIYLGVTAGTLPAGWYPIAKVTSATSMVIMTPKGTVWTATAATVPGTTVAPATYSPLITITGMMATVTATMSV